MCIITHLDVSTNRGESHPPYPVVLAPESASIDWLESQHLPQGIELAIAGRIRPYKNYQWLLRALSMTRDVPMRVVVAGHPDHAETVAALGTYAAQDERLIVYAKKMTPTEYDRVISHADFAVLAQPSPWSSGSAVHAASRETALIGYLPAMFDVEDEQKSLLGVFAENDSAEAFVGAMRTVCQLSPSSIKAMGHNARKILCDSMLVAATNGHAELYERALERNRC